MFTRLHDFWGWIALTLLCALLSKCADAKNPARPDAQEPNQFFSVAEAPGYSYQITSTQYSSVSCDTFCSIMGDGVAEISSTIDPRKFIFRYIPEPLAHYQTLLVEDTNDVTPGACHALVVNGTGVVIRRVHCDTRGNCLCQKVPTKPTRPDAQVPEAPYLYMITDNGKYPYRSCDIFCQTIGNGVAEVSNTLDPRQFIFRYIPEPLADYQSLWVHDTSAIPPGTCHMLVLNGNVMALQQLNCGSMGHCLCQKDPPATTTGVQINVTGSSIITSTTKSPTMHSVTMASQNKPTTNTVPTAFTTSSSNLTPQSSHASTQTLTSTPANISLIKGKVTITGPGRIITPSEVTSGNASTGQVSPNKVTTDSSGPPPIRSSIHTHDPSLEYQCPKEPKSVFGHIKRCYKMKQRN